MQKKYVLITGSSSGLGKELAIECAKRGFNLILIALPNSEITFNTWIHELTKAYEVDLILELFDLTDHELLEIKIKELSNKYPIFFLINNAGVGGTARITSSPMKKIDQIIQLNICSTVFITKGLLSNLIRNKPAYILNIASLAAFTPIAYKTVYPASKAFISSFSLGLREELKEYGVSVSTLYPGAIMTNSSISKRIMNLGLRARMGLLPTPVIASYAIQKSLKRRAIIVPGWFNRLTKFLIGMLPLKTNVKLSSKMVKKELKEWS